MLVLVLVALVLVLVPVLVPVLVLLLLLVLVVVRVGWWWTVLRCLGGSRCSPLIICGRKERHDSTDSRALLLVSLMLLRPLVLLVLRRVVSI